MSEKSSPKQEPPQPSEEIDFSEVSTPDELWGHRIISRLLDHIFDNQIDKGHIDDRPPEY